MKPTPKKKYLGISALVVVGLLCLFWGQWSYDVAYDKCRRGIAMAEHVWTEHCLREYHHHNPEDKQDAELWASHWNGKGGGFIDCSGAEQKRKESVQYCAFQTIAAFGPWPTCANGSLCSYFSFKVMDNTFRLIDAIITSFYMVLVCAAAFFLYRFSSTQRQPHPRGVPAWNIQTINDQTSFERETMFRRDVPSIKYAHKHTF